MSEIGLMSPPPFGTSHFPYEPERACRSCGCTDLEACEGGCWWVESDLCSACLAREGLE
jgi:hypothetical protein